MNHLISKPCESSCDELDASDHESGFGSFDGGFEVLCETATAPQLGEGAFDPVLRRFGCTISDNGLLCQRDLGFQAGLDTGSNRGDGEVFYISWP